MVQHTSLKAPWRESGMKYLHGRHRTDLRARRAHIVISNWFLTGQLGRDEMRGAATVQMKPPRIHQPRLTWPWGRSRNHVVVVAAQSFRFVRIYVEDVRTRVASVLGQMQHFLELLSWHCKARQVKSHERERLQGEGASTSSCHSFRQKL